MLALILVGILLLVNSIVHDTFPILAVTLPLPPSVALYTIVSFNWAVFLSTVPFDDVMFKLIGYNCVLS